jgi:hypothetical protein
LQHGDKYEMRINNQSFTHLWDQGKKQYFNLANVFNQERTRRHFNYEDKTGENDPYKAKDYAENYK